jgi:hypothetical protein
VSENKPGNIPYKLLDKRGETNRAKGGVAMPTRKPEECELLLLEALNRGGHGYRRSLVGGEHDRCEILTDDRLSR